MLFGALGVAMVSLALAGSTDPHIRSYWYKLLSSTMTFLISLLLSEASWSFLFELYLPKWCGLGFQVKPGIKIEVSFVVFTLSYMSLNFFGWKCQFSRARLYVMKTLGAHICAAFGISTFIAIQHEAVFSASVQFQGPIMGEWAAQVFTAFLVVVLAWLTFSLYRAAAAGAREEIFREPPSSPWPPQTNPPVVSREVRTRAASCIGWGTTQPPEPIQKFFDSDWGTFVDAAEDEATVIVLGFLFNQALTFLVAGKMPEVRVIYTHDSTRVIQFWIVLISTFLVLLLLVLFIRARFGDGGRLGSIINRTLAMSLGWCVYRAASWAASDYLRDVQVAFVISTIAVVLMIVMDKILNCALGRNGTTLSELAMRIAMTCMGLLMALAWETAISFSVETSCSSRSSSATKW